MRPVESVTNAFLELRCAERRTIAFRDSRCKIKLPPPSTAAPQLCCQEVTPRTLRMAQRLTLFSFWAGVGSRSRLCGGGPSSLHMQRSNMSASCPLACNVAISKQSTQQMQRSTNHCRRCLLLVSKCSDTTCWCAGISR